MKTRTLLLLAFGCGLAILLAGGVQLLRVAGSDEQQPLAVGESASVGDLDVTVIGSTEADGRLLVELSLGGVVDDDVADDFGVVASGERLLPLTSPAGVATPCGAVVVVAAACTLAFDVTGIEGRGRVLTVERGDQSELWAVAAG